MLETVAKGFKAAKDKLTGKATVSAQSLDAALRDIRLALLEADVSIDVAKDFLKRVKERAEQEVVEGTARFERGDTVEEVTPYHRFVAICQEELEALMGGSPDEPISFAPMGVTAVMIVGLQGSGKTTTSGKLARFIRDEFEKKPLLVAADLQRPAAVAQLQTLGQRIDVPVHANQSSDPLTLCGEALAGARQRKRDVVIFDTAGRLAVDEALMEELRQIKARTQPQEILLVVDAMSGQDAVRTAEAFDEALGLTGVVMTKLDGDARGGAALSIKAITGKPIKFLGVGEGMEALETFRAEGLASRILGMGDVVGLVREFERHVDQDKAEEDAERMFRGQFDMSDFVEQIGVLQKMGTLKDLFERMPVFQEGMPEGFRPDEREFTKIIAVHNSMTPLERRRPALIRDPSRLARVSGGCGLPEAQVLEVLSKFDTMRRMMIALGDEPSLLSKIPGFNQVAQVRKLRGLDMTELFGDAFEAAIEDDDEEDIPLTGAPKSPTKREYFSDMARPPPPKKSDRAKQKNKKKQARKARKKNRR
ncbi:MAG: signal recognition particle receptor subunit alpha [Myxococcota bacterium]